MSGIVHQQVLQSWKLPMRRKLPYTLKPFCDVTSKLTGKWRMQCIYDVYDTMHHIPACRAAYFVTANALSPQRRNSKTHSACSEEKHVS